MNEPTECLYELNPMGGLERTHHRLCGYQTDCVTEATEHLRVSDRGWCGNVCKRHGDKIAMTHVVRREGTLRGLEANEAEYAET